MLALSACGRETDEAIPAVDEDVAEDVSRDVTNLYGTWSCKTHVSNGTISQDTMKFGADGSFSLAANDRTFGGNYVQLDNTRELEIHIGWISGIGSTSRDMTGRIEALDNDQLAIVLKSGRASRNSACRRD